MRRTEPSDTVTSVAGVAFLKVPAMLTEHLSGPSSGSFHDWLCSPRIGGDV
jgi:hypothetical protein